jgi:putative DNA-invertase from lambdoid prophage Rac
MPRIFAYARVSTSDQTTDNQIREIEAAGFAIEGAKRVVTETISGSVAALERPGFAKLIDRLESGDALIVTKLDRLGRNAMDVRATVELLASHGIRVHCLALGGMDLTSAAGKMTMGVIASVAEFERDLLIERTQAGLTRARAEGKTLGRPSALTTEQQGEVLRRLAAGEAVAKLARDFDTSRTTIQRLREKQIAEVSRRQTSRVSNAAS